MSIVVISPDAKLHESMSPVWAELGTRPVRFHAPHIDFDDILDKDPAAIIVHLATHVAARDFVIPLAEIFAAKQPPIPTLVIADEYDGPLFRDLLAAGAQECLTRPLDVRRLTFLLRVAAIGDVARAAVQTPLAKASDMASEPYRAVCLKAAKVADKSAPLLLTGETGVGKTHLAKLIHLSSSRAGKPFVALNCGALSENLIESELFGHVKGAFTGAIDDYPGHLAAAKTGTLLLDEIDALTPAMQAKLLRLLDSEVYHQVGSVVERKFQARLITASNRPLEQAVNEGAFRKDLYYRLRVVELNIPPLRERKSEIRVMGLQFVREFCAANAAPLPRVLAETWQLLESHSWPGNIRELRNCLHAATAFVEDGELRPDDLPRLSFSALVPTEASHQGLPDGQTASKNLSRSESLRDARLDGERRRVLEALQRCNFNKARAAAELGISRGGFYKRLGALGL